jgi:hypothetical protein
MLKIWNMERIIVVEPEYRICSKCGENGHNRIDCRISDSLCYKRGYERRCSRCDQPGHSRYNREKCSLFVDYKNLTYYDIVNIKSPVKYPIQSVFAEQHFRITSLKMFIKQIRIYSIEIQKILKKQEVFNNEVYSILTEILYNINKYEEYISIPRILETATMTNDVKHKLTDIIRFLKECHCEILHILLDMSQIDLIVLNNYVLTSPLNIIGNINSWVIHAQNIVGYPTISRKHINIINEYFDVSECCICYESNNHTNSCLTGCKHEFCVNCITSLSESRITKNNIPCPMCRDDIKELIFNKDAIISEVMILLTT